MEKSKKEILNDIYQPLSDKAHLFCSMLASDGYEPYLRWFNFANGNSEQEDFATRYYPVPVISVPKLGDLTFDFDCLTLSMSMKIRKALTHNWSAVARKYKMRIYGVANSENDIYAPEMDADTIALMLKASGETDVNICMYLPPSTDYTAFKRLVALKNASEQPHGNQVSMFGGDNA